MFAKPGRYRDSLRNVERLIFPWSGDETIPHIGFTSLRSMSVFSTAQSGLDESSEYVLSAILVTVTPERSSLPLNRKRTFFITAFVAEMQEYMGIVQLEPGRNRSGDPPSCGRGLPYSNPHSVAMLLMLAMSVPPAPRHIVPDGVSGKSLSE